MTSHAIAEQELLSLVRRILNVKEEQDALQEQIREIYQEVKDQGFDKTIVGQIVARKRKEAKDPAKFEESADLLELYLTAIERAERAVPSHTREAA